MTTMLVAIPLEWVFLFTSILLVCFVFYALREAIIDSAFLVANEMNGPRTVIADQNIREESIKLGIGMVMIVTAITSILLTPPSPRYPQALVSMVAWMVVAILMVVSSVLSKSVRRQLQQFSPVEVRKMVGTIEHGSKETMAASADAMRSDTHVRHGERKDDQRRDEVEP